MGLCLRICCALSPALLQAVTFVFVVQQLHEHVSQLGGPAACTVAALLLAPPHGHTYMPPAVFVHVRFSCTPWLHLLNVVHVFALAAAMNVVCQIFGMAPMAGGGCNASLPIMAAGPQQFCWQYP